MANFQIPLSPLDQMMPRIYTRVFLAFHTNEITSSVERLRTGIQHTCNQLPYLKGRVIQNEGNGRLDIIWSTQDAIPDFQDILPPAEMPSYAEMIAQDMPLPYFAEGLCPVRAMPDHSKPGASAPVMAISYTKLDGGLLFCICVHHIVMDGAGLGELINMIARHTRQASEGLEVQLKPDEPLHRTKSLESAGKSDGTVENLLQLHPEYTTAPVKFPSSLPPPCTSQIFTFSIQKLRSLADVLASTTTTKSAPSINILLSAIVWSCISEVRVARRRKDGNNTSEDPTSSKLGVAVDGRRFLGSGFSSVIDAKSTTLYLGNVSLYGLATCDYNKLIPVAAERNDNTNLTAGVDAITAAIVKITPTYIAEVVTLFEEIPDVRSVRPVFSSFDGPDLTITSWTNLDMYTADFGDNLGTPDSVRIPYAQFDGLVVALPRKRNLSVDQKPHEVEVVVMLRRDDMEELERHGIWSSLLSV